MNTFSPISREKDAWRNSVSKPTELGSRSSGAKTATVCLGTSDLNHCYKLQGFKELKPMSLPFHLIFIRVVLKSRRFKWERQRPKNPPVILLCGGGGEGGDSQNPKNPYIIWCSFSFLNIWLCWALVVAHNFDFLWAMQDLSSQCRLSSCGSEA